MTRSKTGLWFVAALCAAAGAMAFAQEKEKESPQAQIDKPVKEFNLKDLTKTDPKAEDAAVALAKFKDKKPVVLFFMSEKCGTTWKYEKRFGKLLEEYGKKDVAFFGVRCSANDSEESICKFAEAKNFAMPVLNDADGEMTRFYKVTNTPTFVLIDKKGVMRYRGSFDDNPEEPEVQHNYLPDAIKAVMNSKEVAVKMTRPFG